MTLIAYGEIRFLTGDPSLLFARFAQEDGHTFDMPLSEEQFGILVAGVNPEQPPAPQRPAPQKHASMLDDEEGVDDIRPFTVGYAASEEEDDL